MDKEFQMIRTQLEWPDPLAGVTVSMHRAAWDRLRTVCRELGFIVPTLSQISQMTTLPEVYDHHVLAASLDDGKPYLVNFDIGYVMSSEPYKT